LQQNKIYMRKLSLIIATIVLLIGCGRKHIYHTYYKDIDTDTMPPIHDENGSIYYTLNVTRDSPPCHATYTKPFEYKRNGKDIVDYNTGFSIDIASDMGNRADRTAIHELGHLTSGLSDGLAPNTQYGKTIYGKLTDPVVSDYPALNKQIITRGKRYQHFMVDYNDDLLPRRSKLLDDVFNSPDRAVNVFENSGYSRDQAEKLVNRLKTEYNYLWDKQEQQMFLKDWFIKDIKPLLKNPNNATEIEQVLLTHPELVNNNPNVYDIIKTIRPGSIKDYAKYLSASLSTLPFVKKEFKK
jgi:hypothetical protein